MRAQKNRQKQTHFNDCHYHFTVQKGEEQRSGEAFEVFKRLLGDRGQWCCKCWAFFEGRYLLISRFVGHDCRIRRRRDTKGRIDAGPANLEACSVHTKGLVHNGSHEHQGLYILRPDNHPLYAAALLFKSPTSIGALSGQKSQRKCLVELSRLLAGDRQRG